MAYDHLLQREKDGMRGNINAKTYATCDKSILGILASPKVKRFSLGAHNQLPRAIDFGIASLHYGNTD